MSTSILDAVLEEVYRPIPGKKVIPGRAKYDRDGIASLVDKEAIEAEIDFEFAGEVYALDVLLGYLERLPATRKVVQLQLKFKRGDDWISYKDIFDKFAGNESSVRVYILDLLLRKTPREGSLTEEQRKYAHFFAALIVSAELLRARQSIAVAVMSLIAVKWSPLQLLNVLYKCTWFTGRGMGCVFQYSSIDSMKSAVELLDECYPIQDALANELITAYNLDKAKVGDHELNTSTFYGKPSSLRRIISIFIKDRTDVEEKHPSVVIRRSQRPENLNQYWLEKPRKGYRSYGYNYYEAPYGYNSYFGYR